ncbi:hypothetical protein GW915_12220 [bacterium]|nr:hypothetical protein [bacterium]
MKASPFLIFILVLLFLFVPNNHTGAQVQEVSVSAFVDEHLTFLQEREKLTVSTNLPVNFLLISASDSNKFYLTGPAERSFPSQESFILVAEF